MHNKKLIFRFSILILLLLTCFSYSQEQDRVFGITIDGINNLNNIVNTIGRHKQRMTTRIVFDEWQSAENYSIAVNRIDSVSSIMGELLDSYYMNNYSVQQFNNRVDEYLAAFGDKVDIWEIGNEINGEWLGNRDSVLTKLMYAYSRTNKYGYKSAVTLYYNKNCWENPQNEMFRWVNENLREHRKFQPDYVLVSYYEDDCNNLQPNWQQVFDSLHTLFPNSKLGIGECGTEKANKKAEYINRYYKMNVTTPNYIGGYFWWYYRQDCIPWNSKPLWQVLEDAINSNSGIRDGDGY